MTVDLRLGDCLAILPTLAENSVDLVLTDPPYSGVKDDEWDRQWATRDEYLAWLDLSLAQFARLLKPNGSLYVFASPQMAAHVEVLIGRRFNVLNSISWWKENGNRNWSVDKSAVRSFLPNTERIIFAEHYGADNMAKGEAGYEAACDDLRGFVFEPLRAYLRNEWQRAGLTPDAANEACGTASMAGHYFSISQWRLPTAEHYENLRRYANHNNGGGYLRREYEDLRREYEDLRRPFTVSADVPYTDVWTFPTVNTYPGKHPCEKPLEMMRHIILASSRPGATVLDCFMGSGSTGVAAIEEGRDFIGIESAEEYYLVAEKRIMATRAQPRLIEVAPGDSRRRIADAQPRLMEA